MLSTSYPQIVDNLWIVYKLWSIVDMGVRWNRYEKINKKNLTYCEDSNIIKMLFSIDIPKGYPIIYILWVYNYGILTRASRNLCPPGK